MILHYAYIFICRNKKVASGFIGRLLPVKGNPLVLISNSHVLQTQDNALTASVTFGYVNKDNQGITKNGKDIFDMKMWRTDLDINDKKVC